MHEGLLEQLTEMIQEGELPPGSRLPEIALCEHFGVSRTPMREALKILAADGLLVWKQNYGVWVSGVDVDDVREVFEVLGGLELVIGSLLVERVDDAAMRQIEALHAGLAKLHAEKDRTAYFKQNQQIHLRLAEATGNRALRETYAALSKKLYRARTMANYTSDRWDRSIAEHSDFMESLRQRDGQALAHKLKAHNEATSRAVLKGVGKQARDGVSRKARPASEHRGRNGGHAASASNIEASEESKL